MAGTEEQQGVREENPGCGKGQWELVGRLSCFRSSLPLSTMHSLPLSTMHTHTPFAGWVTGRRRSKDEERNECSGERGSRAADWAGGGLSGGAS